MTSPYYPRSSAPNTKSRTAVIAERGGRVQDKFEEIARERRLADELGIPLDGATTSIAPPPGNEDEDTDPRRTRQRQARFRVVRSTGDMN